MAEEHVYEEHVHTFGGRLKELMADNESEKAAVSDAELAEKRAGSLDPFARESSRDELEREIAERVGSKTAEQELGLVLLKQDIEDLDGAPGVDLEQFITSARNG